MSFDSKHVLELGCGIGHLGLSILLQDFDASHIKDVDYTAPLGYYFTDSHPRVLETLRHNIRVNLDLPQCEEVRSTLFSSFVNGSLLMPYCLAIELLIS